MTKLESFLHGVWCICVVVTDVWKHFVFQTNAEQQVKIQELQDKLSKVNNATIVSISISSKII